MERKGEDAGRYGSRNEGSLLVGTLKYVQVWGSEQGLRVRGCLSVFYRRTPRRWDAWKANNWNDGKSREGRIASYFRGACFSYISEIYVFAKGQVTVPKFWNHLELFKAITTVIVSDKQNSPSSNKFSAFEVTKWKFVAKSAGLLGTSGFSFFLYQKNQDTWIANKQ